ncbi:MAG: hypothetical protein CM1200mP38_7650 [Dehalococcoidia bacterium]|nr:MAG: hypothetical protein CM1200mP38_7650 [Dehalococcoidia bacterium]
MLVNGVDIVEVPRIKRISEQYGSRFLQEFTLPWKFLIAKEEPSSLRADLQEKRR